MHQIFRFVSGVVVALVTIGFYSPVQSQPPAKNMRVAGEVTAVDTDAGTITVKTSSGPAMVVKPPQAGKGKPELPAVGSQVVVQFSQASAQGVRNDSLPLLGVGGGRWPGIVDATSVTPAPAGFCGCSSPSGEGCQSPCKGKPTGGWSCQVLQDIMYPSVCGLQQP